MSYAYNRYLSLLNSIILEKRNQTKLIIGVSMSSASIIAGVAI